LFATHERRRAAPHPRGYGDPDRVWPAREMAHRGVAIPAQLPARFRCRRGEYVKTLAHKKPPRMQRPSLLHRNGWLQIHRFSVAEYHEMIEAGVLTENHRVELLNGWIVDKMPQDPPHTTAVT